MGIKLTSPDFARLAETLSTIPEFQTVRSRVDLVTDVFAGSPRGRGILASLDLDGVPRGVAVRVVDRLQRFGQDEPGQEALGVLINKMISYLGGGEDADFLRGLLVRYPFQTLATADRPLAHWLGRVSDDQIDEKIIGENTLRHIASLELALEAAKAVVRIKTSGSMGSGFLIAPDLLMTNHHVIADRRSAEASEFQFDYQLDRNGVALPVTTKSAVPDGVFHTHPDLDFTVLQLEAGGPAPLRLKAERVHRDDRVSIIQHPGGHYKKISMQNNFVAYADARIVQYTTSTEPGSSGSPVFDSNFHVVGIHHSGGYLKEPGTENHYLRNEGISMIAILEELRDNAAEVVKRLPSWNL